METHMLKMGRSILFSGGLHSSARRIFRGVRAEGAASVWASHHVGCRAEQDEVEVGRALGGRA